MGQQRWSLREAPYFTVPKAPTSDTTLFFDRWLVAEPGALKSGVQGSIALHLGVVSLFANARCRTCFEACMTFNLQKRRAACSSGIQC